MFDAALFSVPRKEDALALAIEEWLATYRRVWEEADPDGAAALFTEDADYRDNIYEEPHRGRDGVRAYWTEVTSVQSDVTVLMGEPFVDGDRVAAEFWTRMAVNGSPVTLAGCLLLEFDETGLCRRLREYWNFAEGTREPPVEWGS